jgi:type II secretory pathway pseudopilin PulG
MNTFRSKQTSEEAFTFAEMAVAVGVLGLLGLVFFQVLQSGLTLSAKNTAVNAAHEEARQGVLRLTRDLHASISVPQLRDTSFNVVDSTLSPSASPGATPPTAAGVSFQNVNPTSPDYVWKDPGNPNLVMIKDNGAQPVQGMRLLIPAWGIEDDIQSVSSGGASGHSNVFTVHDMANTTTVKNSKVFGGTSYAITYYTNRVMYLVQNGNYVADSKGDFNLVGGQYVQVTPGTGQYHYENGELHYYQWRSTASNPATAGTLYWKDVATVARYLSNPQPFSVPLNHYGGPDNKYVKVKLSARDPKSTNRGYVATSSLLDTQIDYRSRIAIFQ